MKGILIFAAVLCVLYLLARIRVGLVAKYSTGTIDLRLRVGLLHFCLYPRPEKKKRMVTNRKKPAGGRKTPVLRYLPYVPCLLRAIKQVLTDIRVDRLRADILISAPDSADAVIRYGQVNAAIGALWGPFHRLFNVKDAHVHLDADMLCAGSNIRAELSLSWRISQLLSIAFSLIFNCITVAVKERTKNKQESMVAQYG